jgi:hypothetical protein
LSRGIVKKLINASLFISFFYLHVYTSTIDAAEFDIVNRHLKINYNELNRQLISRINPPCHLRMSGEIEQGDLRKLEVAIQEAGLSDGIKGLCLDSTGGSYSEAIRIAKAMLNRDSDNEPWGVPLRETSSTYTVIQSGAKCYSACAIIFMAGNQFVLDEMVGAVNQRFMHAKSDLGFHSPYLDELQLDAQTFDRSTVAATHAAGVAAVRELAELGESIVTQKLIVKMLSRGPGDDLFQIDTVREAFHFKIKVFGIQSLSKITSQQLCIACLNQFHHTHDLGGSGCSGDNFCGLGSTTPSARGSGTDRELWFDTFGAEGSYYCVVKPETGRGGMPAIYAELVGLGRADEELEDYNFLPISPAALYRPNTPLKRLAK